MITCDFEGNEQLATSVGSYVATFTVYDEGGFVVASPKLWIHVVDNPGVTIVNTSDDFDILAELIGRISGAEGDIKELFSYLSSGGEVTIPVGEWNDENPAEAIVKVVGAEENTLTVLYPANDESRAAAAEARLAISPMNWPEKEDVNVFRASGSKIPERTSS